jgi:molybdenum cofactor cytidylyltransferase
MLNTTAIIMASGFSKRFGDKNKLLVSFRGKPLARYTMEIANGIDFQGGIFCVTACDDVAALAADLNKIKVIKNTAPEKGRRESVRLGLEAAGINATYYLFFTCDQPFLDTDTVQQIINAKQYGCIVEPHYQGRQGNPCLFSSVFREELLSLKQGKTPRLIKERHPEALIRVEVTNPLALEDIDDQETFTKLDNTTYELEIATGSHL